VICPPSPANAVVPAAPDLGLPRGVIVDRKAEKDIDSLFSGPKTTALLDNIGGLDDLN
jgi:hypothetical protein